MSCCAPCSCGAIKQLVNGEICGIDDFIVMFFNPNIFPETEYQKRLNEQIKYCEKMGVKYVVGDYDHKKWKQEISGLENEPERGARCSKCFAYRFCYAREYAIKMDLMQLHLYLVYHAIKIKIRLIVQAMNLAE